MPTVASCSSSPTASRGARAAARYRNARVLEGQYEEPKARSPLEEIGVDIREGDYVLFYGAGLTNWNYDATTGEWTHQVHPFSNENYYFIKIGGATASQRVGAPTFPAFADAVPVAQVTGRYVRDLEEFIWSKENPTGLDWMSKTIRPGSPRPILENMALPGLAGGEVRYRTRVAIRSNPAATVQFVSGGTVLHVPAGVEIELPITTYRWLDVEGVALFPHTLVVAGANSKVTYVEECASPKRAQEGLAMNCGVAEVIAEEGANVRYAVVQQWGRHVFHYQANRVFAGKDSRVQTVLVTLGAKVARSDVECDLQNPGAESEMLGIYLADDHQHFDHYTYQLHQAPSARSDLLYKGALKDKSRAVFRGMIRVMKGAQQTDAYQTNRNLLLSEDAHADSLPNLEIEADDVRCSHAATVGQLDEEELFYIMSRGISRRSAERLVVFGFFGDVLERLPMPGVVQELRSEIERKLG